MTHSHATLCFRNSVGSCELNSRVAHVIFFTNGDTVTTGFRMNYTTVIGSSSYGRHVIASDTPSQIVDHPESGTYTNNEMSTFVYAPGFQDNPNVDTRCRVNVKGLGGGDDVWVYSLDSGFGTPYMPMWVLEAR